MMDTSQTHRSPWQDLGETQDLRERQDLREIQMPDSVRVELERSRGVLEAILSDESTDTLVENLLALRLLGADAHLLGAIVRRLSLLAPRLTGPGGLAAWLTAVREVTEQARHCTLALLASSEEVLRHSSPAELLMWARLGLRHGQRASGRVDCAETAEAGSMLAHFELRSRESAQSMARGEHGERRADLAASKARLTHLLRALFDMAPALLTVEQGLATRRPFVSNLGLHLPEVGRGLRGVLAQRWYDAAALHAAAHLRHSVHRFERGSLKPIQIALVGVLEDARVELIAVAELPGLRCLWGGFHHAEPAHGGSLAVLMLRLARGLLDPAHADPHPWVARGRRMFSEQTDDGRAPDRLTPAALREIASVLGNDIGQMRLQFNDREYVVEPAYRDDNAYLWLPEEDTPPQVQTVADEVPVPPVETKDDRDDSDDDSEQDADDSVSTPRARALASGERSPDRPPLARLQYPEWDRLVGDYRSAWCTVLESRPMPGDPRPLQRSVDAHAALRLRLERVLRSEHLRERVKLRAQLRGDDLDIDAAVRSAIDRRTHHTPGQKVHQRFDRRVRDVAALVLLDCSASTADALSETLSDTLSETRAGESTGIGRTVLDLAREAALLTALTLLNAGDRCAIHAFASNGRHEVHYERALDFNEVLGPRTIARLAGVRSHLSTRMGAALRHAATLLAAQPQHKRVLLFVTDGEPQDIDIFDRRYLVEDARRAVLEAGRIGLVVFCVTLDPAADDCVRAIFGAGNYRVLDRIESLPRILPAMVLRLTR